MKRRFRYLIYVVIILSVWGIILAINVVLTRGPEISKLQSERVSAKISADAEKAAVQASSRSK
jgi:hypothetical protein